MSTEAKVGAFALGCFAVLAFTVIFLAKAEFSGKTVPYRTYLRYAGGLQPGASVLYGGINTGKVTAVRPWATDPTRIEILLEVKEGTPLNEKSVAKLGFVSIMNSAALSITTGTIDAKALPPGSVVPSQEGASIDEIAGKLATVADNANTLITQAQGELNQVSGNVNHLLANVEQITGAPNQRKVQAILDNIGGLIADARPKIDHITAELDNATQHADETIQNANGTITDLRGPIRADLTELQTTLQQARTLLQSTQAIVRGNDYKIDDTIENLRQATDNLSQFTDLLNSGLGVLFELNSPRSARFRNRRPGGKKPHMKKLTATFVLMVALTALTSCARTRYPSYYTLNVPPAPDPVAQAGVRPSIAVQEFRSPAYLRQGPIVYRVSSEQIGFYEYHRWASDPRTVVTSAVLDHLRADGQFSMVSTYNGHADMDYVLSGRMEKLEEVDSGEGVKVEVAMSAQITRGSTGAPVWSNAVSEVGTVSQRNVTGVVSQMNHVTEVAINKLLSSIPDPLVSAR